MIRGAKKISIVIVLIGLFVLSILIVRESGFFDNPVNEMSYPREVCKNDFCFTVIEKPDWYND